MNPLCTFPSCDCVGRCVSAEEPRFTRPDMASTWNGVSCPYCDVRMDSRQAGREPTWDHIVPKSRGGGNEPSNLLAACGACNSDKSSFLLSEWHIVLVRANDRRAPFVYRVLTLTRHRPGTPTPITRQLGVVEQENRRTMDP